MKEPYVVCVVKHDREHSAYLVEVSGKDSHDARDIPNMIASVIVTFAHHLAQGVKNRDVGEIADILSRTVAKRVDDICKADSIRIPS